MALPGHPFRDRPPDPRELLRFQLLLATFKDGSGNLKMPDGTFRADWRQVERCFADAFDGTTVESKAVFDVDIEAGEGSLPYGLSIKTSARKPDDRVLLELNNSPAKMLSYAVAHGFAEVVGEQARWTCSEEEMGISVISAVKSWHDACRSTHDVDRSCYVVMTHDKMKLEYEVFWLGLDLGRPETLSWSERGRALVGSEGDVVRWEFYRGSGGQLKWYPDGKWAKWRSGRFTLPQPGARGLTDKAQELFPRLWPKGA